jgi:hypothetical protein
MGEFKVVIAGGRDFGNVRLRGTLQASKDFITLCNTMDKLLAEQLKTNTITIISGGAQGADSLGERYARLRNFDLARIKANWNKHNKSAGFVRNKEMLNLTDAVVCFWDEKSTGTKHMVNITKGSLKHLRVIPY